MSIAPIIFAALPYYGSVIFSAFWATSIIWTYRDMRSRSRNVWARFFAAAFVGLLTLPGLLIYWLMRPRETLNSAYARSLEEEALLQEIERTVSCPSCTQATERSWQICPHCHTQLRRSCHSCKTMLELNWSRCPSCLAVQTDTHVPPTAFNLRETPAEPAAAYWQEDEEREFATFAPRVTSNSPQPAYEQYAQFATNGYADADLDFASIDPNDEY